jgi:uncharacterized protein YjiS (DUF1127 family)
MSHSISAHIGDVYNTLRREVEEVIGLAGTIRQHIRDQRQLNQLLNMSDRELNDIGLSRGDVQREATKPLWRI